MNPDLSNKALQQIEALCEEGCSEINSLLKKAGNGDEIERLADFNSSEINLIIDELDQIMSVYNSTDDDSKQENSEIK